MHSSLSQVTRVANILRHIRPRINHLELLWIADHLEILDVWHTTRYVHNLFVTDVDELLLAEMLRIFVLAVLVCEAFNVYVVGDLLPIVLSRTLRIRRQIHSLHI